MKLGNLYATRRIEELIQKNKQFKDDINTALNKYLNHDWGDTCAEDVEINNEALVTEERILSVYVTCEGPVWVITEWNRSSTTILFHSEY